MKKRALVILLVVVISAILQLTISDNLIFSNCSLFVAKNDTTNIVTPIFITDHIQPTQILQESNADQKDWINFISLSDGIDTRFTIRNLNTKYTKVKLSIYNSWGKRIYQSQNYQNEFDARKYPEGTYYYQVHYTQNGVNEEMYKNSFFEIRD